MLRKKAVYNGLSLELTKNIICTFVLRCWFKCWFRQGDPSLFLKEILSKKNYNLLLLDYLAFFELLET